ncbi:hypothetical protein [Pedobacter sp. L105]|uniref:hypothetical protein n=1 Tax=Pedobacter sp. L105 TaxID=1641871 RepID=UPI00131B0055|nr:hypothetical protein [Pedobacter sp. L105]
MKKTYNTLIYNARKGFVYLFLTLILLILLLILTAVKLNTPIIGAIGIGCLFILPFLLEKKIKKIFTTRAFLTLNEENFSIVTSHLTNDITIKELDFSWDKIESYKVYFSPSKNTLLTIYLNDGTSQMWNFKDNKTFDEAASEESVFSLFYSFVKQYNENDKLDKKIVLTPGYLTTKSGTTLLYGISILIIAAVIIHIIKQPNTSVLSLLVGFSILVQQIVKRKQEKALYNKITQLD